MKKKILLNLYSFLEKTDLFLIVPSSRITFGQKEIFSTFLGKIFSIAIYILMTVAIFYFSQNLFYKQEGQSIMSEILTPDPEKFILNKNSFFFSFSLQNSSNGFKAFIDERIYKIEAVLRIKEGGNFSMIKIPLGECDSNDYPSNPELKSYFNYNDMTGYHCIKNYTGLEMIGNWDSDIFKELRFLLQPCKNSSDSAIICKDQKEIDSIFQDGYFGSFLTSAVIDPTNYDAPVKAVPMNFYTRVSLQTYVFYEMSLQHIDVQTDSGFLMEDTNIIRAVSKSTERQSVTINPKDILFELLIRLDRIKKSYQRKYDKIQDVLANLGGILQSIVFLGGVLINSIVEKRFLHKLAKEVFEFEEVVQKSSLAEKKRKKGIGIFKNNTKKDKKKEEHLIKKGIEQINYKMDLSFIMKKLLEIDKMKYILFEADQLFLFNMIPKPKIFSNEQNDFDKKQTVHKYNKILMTKRTHKLNEKEINKINSICSKMNKTQIDKKLIQLLKETEVCKFYFEKNEFSENTRKGQDSLIQLAERKEKVIKSQNDI